MLVNLNLSDTKTEDQFSPVPAGEYNAQITETEVKRTNDSTGTYIAAKFEILDGQHAKRIIFHNFNIQNKNAQAVEIGLRQVKQVAEFGGHRNPDVINDTSELHNLPVAIVVTVRPPEGQYAARNEIKAFKKASFGGMNPAQAAAAYASNAPGAQIAQQPHYGQPAQQQAMPANGQPAQQQPSPSLKQQAAAAGIPPWARG